MAIVCGLSVVVIAQRLAPIGGPPLYDGVVVADPYRWLSPPPGLLGGAKSVTQSVPLVASQDGELAIGTLEVPPQAQVITDFGSLDLPADSTAVTVSVAPVPPPEVQPTKGVIAGNVYRLAVTNQKGEVVAVKAGNKVTVLFRGPTSLPSATIEVFSGSAWTAEPTNSAGIPDMFTAVVGTFGDFALVAPSGWVPAGERAAPSAAAGSTGTATATAGVPAASAPVAATAVASEGAVEAAGTAGPPESAGPADAATPTGTTTQSGPPLAPIAAVAIALLVVLAAAVVFLRPVKPPSD